MDLKFPNRLDDLPENCWMIFPSESRGCQYCAVATLGPASKEVMLDTGPGLNANAEEVVLGVINSCEKGGMILGGADHPVVGLQTWDNQEECRRVAGGVTVPLMGAVVLHLTFSGKRTRGNEHHPIDVHDPSCDEDRLGTDSSRRDVG